MSQRGKMKNEEEQEDEEKGKSVVFLSSSDDDEANMDLSLEIVEKASKREFKGKGKDELRGVSGKIEQTDAVIDLSSSDGVEIVEDWGGVGKGTTVETKTEKRKKLKKKSKGKRKKAEINEPEKFLGLEMSELLPKTPDTAGMEAVEISDNNVMRKLLRGPRYFDAPEEKWLSCYNCGDSGHLSVNCMAEKRKKPCFVCGKFGHGAKSCPQGRECYICKKRGHCAKDCSEKNAWSPQTSKICLRCGYLGHAMSSCRNDYASDDLKEIQCYICQQFGHLCCVDILDGGPRELSCYNCGQSGHTGLGCAKPRGEKIGKWMENGKGSQILCYKCGGEGHFARGCTNSARLGEPSTASPIFSKEDDDFLGFRSVPKDFHADKKKKSIQYEGRTMTCWKSRPRGGWVPDDSLDLTDKDIKSNGWGSPVQLTKRGFKISTPGSGGRFSSSQSPHKKHKFMRETPGSYGSRKPYHGDRYSSPRFSNPRRRFGRTNDY